MFDLDIYSNKAINDTIMAFGELAQISTRQEENCIYCTLDSCKYEYEQTALEFQNYILQLTIQGD